MPPEHETSPIAGRHRLLEANGTEIEASDATFSVEPGALVVQPKAGAPLRVDFADVDALDRGDYVLTLRLATGEKIEASMLGRRFGDLSETLSLALRDFQAKNLLLEEPVGGEGFACDFERDGQGGAGEVRVYATSLAVIARDQVPFGVPFGEVRSVAFDEGRYAIDLETSSGKLSLLRLGKRSQPCARLIESRLGELRQRTAAALDYLVPGIGTLPARKLAQLLPDGVPAQRSQIDAILPDLWPRLVKAAIGTGALAKSFAELAGLCPAGEIAVGIKETGARQDTDEGAEEPEPEEQVAEAAEEKPEEAGAAEAEAEPEEDRESPMAGRVAWFLFPIVAEDRSKPGNAVAVEAVTRQGRATYLFRIAPPDVYASATAQEIQELARERIRSVSRAMVALSFKREPIYLSDEKLRTGRYSRYRLAMRLSAPLKAARATFLGRAIHGPGWRKQIDQALARASK